MRPDGPATSPIRLHQELSRIWSTGPGLARLSAVNHTQLGLRFIVTAAVFFGIGGLLAMVIRAQLASPRSAFLGPEAYNQVFTTHGTVMMFLFAIPMLEGLAVYLLPKMLGARDLAFPRLSAYGYWCFLFGGSIIILALVFGAAPDSGWFMYTPLSSEPYSPGIGADVWLLGITFVEISGLSMAVELVVSILLVRAPGMSLERMPIFAWYMLVTAMMILIGFPPLILGSILLEMERAFGLPFFDPTRGGDPLLWQHLFWLFGHPEVYIIFLPGVGVLSTVIPTFAQRPLIGYRAIVTAIIALGFLSFGLWVHHMFTVGIPHLALGLFSAASALVAIPTAVQIFAWFATLAHGKPRWDLPMLYVFGFFFIFVLGGLTGVMVAMVPFNWQAHDTHFVVAHMHYVLVGGFVFPLLAGLYYWLPHVTGRQAIRNLAVPAFWLIFIGFNLTFFVMHLTGLFGMPRRVYVYPEDVGWTWPNLVSSVGGFVSAIGFALVAIDVVLNVRFGRPTRRDPWRAGTLEWAMPTPPAPYGFASLPHVDMRADRLAPARLGAELAGGGGYLGAARNDWQETIGVHPTSGAPEQVVILPRSTYLPLVLGLATCVTVLGMLFKLYVVATAGAVGLAGLFIYSAQVSGQKVDHGALPVGRGLSLPPHTEVETSPPWLALIFVLVADATLFASLLYGGIYNWLVAPNWPPGELITAARDPALLAAAGLLLGPIAARRARDALVGGAGVAHWIALGAVACAGAIAGHLWLIARHIPDPTGHAYAAATFAILGYGVVHLGIAGLFLVSNALRIAGGRTSPRRTLDLRLTCAWWNYTAIAGLVALGAAVLGLPALVAPVEAQP